MHTPLAGHLHTEECNKIIEEMLKCYEEHNKVQQIFGACDNLYTRMRDWFNALKMVKMGFKTKLSFIFLHLRVRVLNAHRTSLIRKCTKAERLAREAEARKKNYEEVEARAKRVAELQASGKSWQEHYKETLKEKAKKQEEGRSQEK